MNALKKIGLLFLGFLAFALATSAWAYVTWHGTISGTKRTMSFSVWDSPTGGLEIGQPYSIGVGAVDSPYVRDFYIQNDGTVQITVTASGSGTGCTGSWSSGGSYILAVGVRVQATLTLTVTGDFTYDFDFAKEV